MVQEVTMPTRNVVLTVQQDEFVDHLVSAGRFQNASEALRAGLRLLEAEEAEMAAFVARLNAGYDEAMRGERAEGTFQEAVREAFGA
jgi:antitoxin ParD1/3/4